MIRADEHLVLVAEADGEVVGNILVSVDRGRRHRAHRRPVDHDRRSAGATSGIGTELVAAAQRWARERGLRKLSLGVFPDNERAIAVYAQARLRPRGPATAPVPLRRRATATRC